MGRKKRPYLPGSFFHLIGRTQARIHWFDDAIKDRIVQIVADAVEESDVALNAFVIMGNHFHLLAQQGSTPLSTFMQPVMRRTALLLKTKLYLEDHVFGGPYWARVSTDADDLRSCIGYIHRNPVRAGCCSDPADYPWSSHHAYVRVLEPEHWRPRLAVLRGLFARRSCRSESELCLDYRSFVGDDEDRVPGSNSSVGFEHGDGFARDLFAHARRSFSGERLPRKRTDLCDIVQRGISDLCPELDIEMVRTFRGAWMAKVRAELVKRASRGGHRGCQIARFLHMSESRVSRIVRCG